MDNINFLPDHVLVQVFGHLSPGMTKSCCLVCKRWDSIIGTSSELMGKFYLNLRKPHQNRSKMSLIKETQRKHQSIIGEIQYSLDVITRHNLRYLQLINSGTKLSILVKALNNLPSLKVLIVQNANFTDDISKSSNTLKKVYTNIEELHCSVEVTQIFECCTIKNLGITCKETVMNWKTMAVEFLKRQKFLENLGLYAPPNEFFTVPEIFSFNFSLKKFKYGAAKNFQPGFQYYEELIKFLNQHKRSLASLDVSFNTDPHFGIEFVHKFALENIVNLKYLNMGYCKGEYRISYSELPAATQITRNLESLMIRAQSTDMNENRRFFDMMPNLKYLKLHFWIKLDNEFIHCICERCPKLESLHVSSLEDESCLSEAIHFPNLKNLIVDAECDELSAFIDRHSQTLEKIVLGEISDFKRNMARSILNCPNLNHFQLDIFKLGIGSSIMFHEFSLKTKPFTLVLNSQKSKFKFPDDKAIFDAISDNEIDHFYKDL